MRHRLLALATAGLLSIASSALADSYKLDAGHSGVGFSIAHEQNKVFGIFTGLTGTVEITDDGGSVNVSVKTDSINTGIAKRDEHLKGNDFFAVAQFPTITFKSSKVTKSADGTYDVVGNLTLHGVTKELTIKLTPSAEGKGMQGGTVRGFDTKFTIKRSEFGMKGFIPVVGDEVELMISLAGVKQ